MNAPSGSLRRAGYLPKIVCALLSSALLQTAIRFGYCATPAGSPNQAPQSDHCFSYFNDVVPEKPWSIHVVRIERTHPEFVFCTTMGKGNSLGMGIVSEQIRSVPAEAGQPLAAINGDFYEKTEGYEGRPRDLQICFGQVVSSPSGHTDFWVDVDGTPHMTNVFSLFRVVWNEDKTTTSVGLNEPREDEQAVLYTAAMGASTHTTGGIELVLEAGTKGGIWMPLQVGRTYSAKVNRVRTQGDTPLSCDSLVLSLGPKLATRLHAPKAGTRLQIITATAPDLAGVEVAIGGGPALVRNSKALDWNGIFHLRHPRTAVGWNKDYIFLVEVDGRQVSSVGMTFQELAGYLVELGCEEAMNFDGGGSATLWVLGSVRNNPSEGQERPSPNALVLMKRRPAQHTRK